nr:MAG TPA: hypothetical protein [Caudoviricetes sp.]
MVRCRHGTRKYSFRRSRGLRTRGRYPDAH